MDQCSSSVGILPSRTTNISFSLVKSSCCHSYTTHNKNVMPDSSFQLIKYMSPGWHIRNQGDKPETLTESYIPLYELGWLLYPKFRNSYMIHQWFSVLIQWFPFSSTAIALLFPEAKKGIFSRYYYLQNLFQKEKHFVWLKITPYDGGCLQCLAILLKTEINNTFLPSLRLLTGSDSLNSGW